MKTLSFLICVLGLSILISASPDFIKSDIKKESETVPGFAVVELFTSEGCSSCPSADALMARIQKENEGKSVYILAFHVDYWNRLGWKDVFSDPAFTKRQRQYASWLKLPSVYTPQAVVDGNTEFVGSQEASLRKAIAAGLGRKAVATIGLKNVKADKNQVVFDYHVDGLAGNSSFIVALVQKTAESKIRAGENAGRTLSHVQITRAVETIKLSEKTNGTGHINIPAGVGSDNLEVIVLLQNNQNGAISAANRIVLEKHT